MEWIFYCSFSGVGDFLVRFLGVGYVVVLRL